MLGAVANWSETEHCANLRSLAVPLGGCRERLRVGNGACANLRSLAVPLGGCRERLCEFLVGSLC